MPAPLPTPSYIVIVENETLAVCVVSFASTAELKSVIAEAVCVCDDGAKVAGLSVKAE
jgi:hypothetical protein